MRDSNPHQRFWRPRYCRYTNGLYYLLIGAACRVRAYIVLITSEELYLKLRRLFIGADSRLRTYISFCTREGLYLKLYQRRLYLHLPCFVLAYAINRVMGTGANRGFEPLYCTAQYTQMRSFKRKFGTGQWSRTTLEGFPSPVISRFPTPDGSPSVVLF